MKCPSGTGLLLTGSGIYWVLSSSFIASFSVLAPGAFLGQRFGGAVVILATGIIGFTAGVWTLFPDLRRSRELMSSGSGWLFALPLILASTDVSLTVLGLESPFAIVELNPFVEAAVQTGGIIFFSFVSSYFLLSEGVGVMMVSLGDYLARTGKLFRGLPYSIVSGVASFGIFGNIIILSGGFSESAAALGGGTGAVIVSILVYKLLYSSQV